MHTKCTEWFYKNNLFSDNFSNADSLNIKKVGKQAKSVIHGTTNKQNKNIYT